MFFLFYLHFLAKTRTRPRSEPVFNARNRTRPRSAKAITRQSQNMDRTGPVCRLDVSQFPGLNRCCRSLYGRYIHCSDKIDWLKEIMRSSFQREYDSSYLLNYLRV